MGSGDFDSLGPSQSAIAGTRSLVEKEVVSDGKQVLECRRKP